MRAMVQGILGNLVQCRVAAAAAHQVGHISCQLAAEGDGLRGCPSFPGKQHFPNVSGNMQDVVHCAKLSFVSQQLLHRQGIHPKRGDYHKSNIEGKPLAPTVHNSLPVCCTRE